MASCETQLWALVREIEPTPSQKEGAVVSHNNLRDLLTQGLFGQRIRSSYLSGSYARDTAIRPIDDVDIVFVIDPTKWATASTLLLGQTYPTPEKILESFANAIRYRYPVSSVFGQRRSVRLQLYHLDIDVVPAIEVDAKFVLIPDVDTGNWIKAAPRAQVELATYINQIREGRFKPLVKVLKYWNNNLPSTVNLKSFAIETIATWLFHSEPIVSIEDGLYRAFDFIAYCGSHGTRHFQWSSNRGINLGWIGTTIPDAAGTGSNLAANVTDERRSKFLQAAARSRDKMFEAKQTTRSDVALNRVREALHA